MAQLGVAILGAGIGSITPIGPAAGWAIGSAIGGALFGPKAKDSGVPKLEDLTVESATYGTPIPKVYGRGRVRGVVLWQSERRATKHTERVGGGKGGGGSSKITSYTYSMDIFVMLSEGELTAVRKIWLNGKLYYDASAGASAEAIVSTDAPWDDIRIRLGSSSETPDTLYETAVGSGNAPAYRGVATVMFENLQLEDFGNNPPNITAEVSSGPVTYKGPPIGIEDSTPGIPYYEEDGVIDWISNILQTRTSRIGTLGTRERYDIEGELVETETLTYVYFDTDPYSGWTFVNLTPTGHVHGLENVWVITVREQDGVSHRYLQAWVINGVVSPHFRELDGSLFLSGNRNSANIGPSCQYYDGAVYCVENTLWWNDSTKSRKAFKFEAPDGIPSHQIVAEWEESSPYAAGEYFDLYVNSDGVFIITDQGVPSGSSTTWALIRLDHDLNFVSAWRYNPGTTAGFGVAQIAVKYPLLIRGVETAENYEVYELNGDFGGSPYTYGTMTQLESGTVLTQPDNASRTKLVVGDNAGMLGRGYEIITYGLHDASNNTLEELILDQADQVGLSGNDVDASELTDEVAGYIRTGVATPHEFLRPTLPAYQYDYYSSGWKIHFVKRKRPSIAATIPFTDLGVRPHGQALPEPLEVLRTPERELPRRVNVDYISEDRDYQTGSQYASREVTEGKEEETLQLPMLLTDDQAIQAGAIYLHDKWSGRDGYAATLQIKYLYLDPTDIVQINTPSSSHFVRITNIDLVLPSMMEIRGVSVRAPALIDQSVSYDPDNPTYEETFSTDQIDDVYTSDLSGAPAPVENEEIKAIGSTKLVLIDSPILRDADDNAGLYWAARGYSSGWSGAVVFKSSDDSSYTEVDSNGVAATMGQTTDALGDAQHEVADKGNTLNVIVNGTLSTVSDANFYNLEQLAIVGVHGRWEVIAFRDATLESDGSYTISHFLRGLRGTDHNMGNHAAGDNFIVLNQTWIDRFLTDINEDGESRYYKGVSIGKTITSAKSQTFTTNTESLRPLSPVHVKAKRNSSDDITIEWVRRSRIAQVWGVASPNPPIGEESESYEVDILNDAETAVLRTLTSSSESVSYTSAQQTTDFGAPKAEGTLHINVYQISASVDRGTARNAIV